MRVFWLQPGLSYFAVKKRTASWDTALFLTGKKKKTHSNEIIDVKCSVAKPLLGKSRRQSLSFFCRNAALLRQLQGQKTIFLPRGRDPSLPPADLHIGSQVTTTTITTTSHSSWKRDRRTSSGASLLGSSATWHTNTSTKITSPSSLFASKLEVLLFFCLQNRLYNAGHATKPLPLVTKAMPRWSKDFVTKRFHRLASQRKLFLLIYINKKRKKNPVVQLYPQWIGS